MRNGRGSVYESIGSHQAPQTGALAKGVFRALDAHGFLGEENLWLA